MSTSISIIIMVIIVTETDHEHFDKRHVHEKWRRKSTHDAHKVHRPLLILWCRVIKTIITWNTRVSSLNVSSTSYVGPAAPRRARRCVPCSMRLRMPHVFIIIVNVSLPDECDMHQIQQFDEYTSYTTTTMALVRCTIIRPVNTGTHPPPRLLKILSSTYNLSL